MTRDLLCVRRGDRVTLTRWLAETGGNFDVVVDDGGHTSKQMLRTFEAFWPSLASGGLYFIEDISTIRHGNFDDMHGEAVMADVLQSWIEQLIVWEKWEWGARALGAPQGVINWTASAAHQRAFDARARHPLPARVAFVFCQAEACAIGKA